MNILRLKNTWVELLAAAMLLLAMLDMPYGYYTFMKICICIASGIVATKYYKQSGKITPVAAVFGMIAILFNPVIPIHLSKGIWCWINFVSACIFIAAGLKKIRSNL